MKPTEKLIIVKDLNMSKKYITVVFEYEQGAVLPEKLTEAFKGDGEYKDTRITAVSLEDEISRVEQLESELIA